MYCRLLAVRSSSATRTNLVKHAARNGGKFSFKFIFILTRLWATCQCCWETRPAHTCSRFHATLLRRKLTNCFLLLALLYYTGENATSRSASGKPTHYKPSTMSEMPQPQGSWAHVNAQRQSKYNMHLLAGLGFTGFSLFAVKLIPILMNFLKCSK